MSLRRCIPVFPESSRYSPQGELPSSTYHPTVLRHSRHPSSGVASRLLRCEASLSSPISPILRKFAYTCRYSCIRQETTGENRSHSIHILPRQTIGNAGIKVRTERIKVFLVVGSLEQPPNSQQPHSLLPFPRSIISFLLGRMAACFRAYAIINAGKLPPTISLYPVPTFSFSFS